MTTINNANVNAIIDFKSLFMTEAKILLSDYEYPWSDKGLEEIFKVWSENKGNLIACLSKHPNWNPNRMYISFTANLHRVKDPEAVSDFVDWVFCTMREKTNSNRELHVMEDGRTYNEWMALYYSTNDRETEHLAWHKMHAISDSNERLFIWGKKYYFRSTETINKFKALDTLLNLLSASHGHTLSAEESETINKAFAFWKNNHDRPIVRTSEGQKWSRIVSKIIGKLYGLESVKDIQTREWMTEDGVWHRREIDEGWNKKFAEFADGINPFEVKRHTIISVNPIDYWTMSFGTSWASCHTIDKDNRRRVSSTYSGCYSSGTESYMLDPTTVIMYTVEPGYDESLGLENADKERRCVFCIDPEQGIITQSRVYPDGRDGGDSSIAAQFREIMQKVISECMDLPNLWVTKQHEAGSYIVTTSGATHYRDYDHYADNAVSFIKAKKIEREETGREVKMLPVGHQPICPNCGESHYEEEWITCDRCRNDGNYIECARCGALINLDEDSYVYDEDSDRYFCDEECAERYDVYYCSNVNEYHSEHVYFDDYEEEYFYDRWDEFISAADGSIFQDAETAGYAGYVYVERENEWYRENDCRFCEHCAEWVLEEDYNEDEETCNCCLERLEREIEE